jgi:hypothetical protein
MDAHVTCHYLNGKKPSAGGRVPQPDRVVPGARGEPPARQHAQPVPSMMAVMIRGDTKASGARWRTDAHGTSRMTVT